MKSAACFLLALAGCGSSLLGVNTDSDSGAPVDGGDASGNDDAGDDGGDAEKALIDEIVADIAKGALITCGEKSFFSKYHDAQPYGVKACDCLEYTFMY